MELETLKKAARKARKLANSSDPHNRYDCEIENIMQSLNDALGGYGVEAVNLPGAYVSRFWRECIALYVNLGDTYDTTLLYDTSSDAFRVTSWGDFFESAEARLDRDGSY